MLEENLGGNLHELLINYLGILIYSILKHIGS